VVLAVALLALIVWYLWGRREKHIGYVIPILLWLLNVSGYQISRIVDPGISAESMSYWGIYVLLHAALTLFVIGGILFLEREHE
jgi:hypothetical protein